MRQQLINLTRPLYRQVRENAFQISIRIMPMMRVDWIRLMIAAAHSAAYLTPQSADLVCI
ncbi:hypothetical protein NZ708_22875 [Pseudomonas syringae pv. actinidiae ICMP 18708]|nr:hypothetical protein IYO_022895 [Pseudomonas syringae pv. actinidiae ICMP 18884]AOE58659.1 hypothetical protein NZ708_22875 [Pseudomonas syringae pv. actinidiae ICMP 18708]APP99613.1 hypothetical protein PsaNZ45_23435 [Pseudomonas syringae pv. actinidiae]APQ05373.1 hypothetical protein PsaNZ47_22875 [Pseudomonas syringae pv. actinidiae]AQX61000.1 hypothetical protein B1R35_25120 [Pseudomonas syringae pv. actinidiae]